MREQPVRPAWQRPFPLGWLDEGMDLLRRINQGLTDGADENAESDSGDEVAKKDDDSYRNKVLKRRILKFIAIAHWKALLRHADRSELAAAKKGDEEIEQTVGRLLGTHRATPLRWTKETSPPESGQIFATLTVLLRQEMHEVEFPNKYDIVWHAVSKTVPLIREKDLKLKPGRETFGREEHACVWCYVRHAQSRVSLEPDTGLEKVRAGVIRDVVIEVRRRFPEGRIRTVADGNRVVEAWLNAYLVFRVGLLTGWEVIDDEAA